MPDFYYLINVRSGLALDVATEGGRGGSPLIQMPMSWENLPETREGDSSRLWRCAGGSGNMNKRDWLVNKDGLVLGHRSELMLGHERAERLYAFEDGDGAQPSDVEQQRYQVSEYFNRDGIFGAFLIWDEMDCVLGVEDASCQPGARIVQCPIDYGSAQPHQSQAWYLVPEFPEAGTSSGSCTLLPWERQPAPRLAISAA